MRNISKHLWLAVVLLVVSCTTSKDVVYMQDIDEVHLKEITSRYEAKIKKDDLLNIVVSGPDKQVVVPYNLTLNESMGGGNDPEKVSLPYLVDINGDINFPIFGKIHVEGMTRSQLTALLTERISEDVKDPVVSISFRNYKVTVIGEVKAPGTYTMDSEKITIFQALSRAGDLTLNALREDVVLIREVEGVNTYYKINLKSAELMNENYYYMQQNDVIYVPPSARRVRAATTNTAVWGVALSTVSSLIAVVSFLISLKK